MAVIVIRFLSIEKSDIHIDKNDSEVYEDNKVE